MLCLLGGFDGVITPPPLIALIFLSLFNCACDLPKVNLNGLTTRTSSYSFDPERDNLKINIVVTTSLIIDDAWKEHLRAMDDLKQSVQTATYEQKDPLVIYKMEAFDLFKKMDGEVNREIVQFLCHSAIPLNEGDTVKEGRHQKTDLSKMKTQKEDIDQAPTENDYYDPTPVKQQPIQVGPKIGRNDPCPCGAINPATGEIYKYKKCGLINAPQHRDWLDH